MIRRSPSAAMARISPSKTTNETVGDDAERMSEPAEKVGANSSFGTATTEETADSCLSRQYSQEASHTSRKTNDAFNGQQKSSVPQQHFSSEDALPLTPPSLLSHKSSRLSSAATMRSVATTASAPMPQHGNVQQKHIPRLPLRAIIAEDGELDENDQATVSIKATLLPGHLQPPPHQHSSSAMVHRISQAYRVEKYPSNLEVCRIANLCATISHPHIVELYGMGDQFLVTSVWDQTLANCLSQLAKEEAERQLLPHHATQLSSSLALDDASHTSSFSNQRSARNIKRSSPRIGVSRKKAPLGSRALNLLGVGPRRYRQRDSVTTSQSVLVGPTAPLGTRRSSSVASSEQRLSSDHQDSLALRLCDRIRLWQDVALPITRALLYLHTHCRMALLNLSPKTSIVIDWGQPSTEETTVSPPKVYLRDFSMAVRVHSLDASVDPRQKQDIGDLGLILNAISVAQPFPPGQEAAQLDRLIGACCHSSPALRPSIRRVHKRLLELIPAILAEESSLSTIPVQGYSRGSSACGRPPVNSTIPMPIPSLDGFRHEPLMGGSSHRQLSASEARLLRGRYPSKQHHHHDPTRIPKHGWGSSSVTTASMTDNDTSSMVSSSDRSSPLALAAPPISSDMIVHVPGSRRSIDEDESVSKHVGSLDSNEDERLFSPELPLQFGTTAMGVNRMEC